MKKKTLKRIDLLLLVIVILLITVLVYRISNKEKLSDAYLAGDTSDVLVYDEDDKEVSLVRDNLFLYLIRLKKKMEMNIIRFIWVTLFIMFIKII